MKQIRAGIFETNSSSTHSLMIVSKEEWEKFKNGGLFYDTWDSELVETKEAVDEYSEDRYVDFSGYWERIKYMEDFLYEYTSKSGDEIVAFGYHGYDS